MIRAAFLTTHLTGTGHLVRTLAIAEALRAMGHDALVLNGGRPLDHLAGAVEHLPPVTVPDFDFRTLRLPDGTPAGGRYMASRRQAIGLALDRFRPDALITETFPLGRRVLADEFESAIACVRHLNLRARVIASVRDIPEPKPNRLDEAAARLEAHYDRLMVHGDPDFIGLDQSWPLPGFADRTSHTGYVATGPAAEDRSRGETVLVSVGGGILGRRLLGIAVEAAAFSPRPWHLLVGGTDAPRIAAEMTARVPLPNLTVEPPRSDYRALLAAAAVSVSLAGYNTVTDLARCNTPAILVPFEEHGEREQAIRADALAVFPGFTRLSAAHLTPQALADAAERAAGGPRCGPLPIRLDGAEQAARIILLEATEGRVHA